MKPFCLLALLAFLVFASKNASAGAAVALAPHNQMATAYGDTIKQAAKRALAEARRRYGSQNVRLLAATDVTGYGAIAVARHPNGNLVIGVALGRRSATEADVLAIEQCRKAGGIKPQVKWGFWG
jgi:hypothetical protein